MPTVEQSIEMTESKDSYDDLLVSEIIDRFHAAQKARSPFEKIWYVCMAFIDGRQWVSWDQTLETLVEEDAPEWREHVVHNFMQVAVRIAVSKLTKHQPVTNCLPNTTEKDDIESTRIGDKVVKYWRNKHGWMTKMTDLMTWVATLGCGYVKTGWNPHAGRMFTCRPPNPATDTMTENWEEEGKPKKKKGSVLDRMYDIFTDSSPTSTPEGLVEPETYYEGEVAFEVTNPFEIYLDPRANTWDDCQYLIQARLVHRDDVREVWGDDVADKGDAETGTNLWQSPGFDKGKISGLTGLHSVSEFFSDTDPGDYEEDAIPMYEFWERPSTKYPEGRWVTIVGHTVVRNSVIPFKFRDFPYQQIIFEVTPGRIYSRGVVESLIPSQRYYNETLSQILENVSLTSNPKYAVSDQADLDDEALTNEPGEVVFVRGTLYPEMLQGAPIPKYVLGVIDHVIKIIQEISAQHEVSRAQVPPNVEAAIAIEMLKEEDDTQLGPTFHRLDEALARHTLYMLMIAQDYYTEERTLHLVGENYKPEVIKFTGADLQGIADLHVVTSSGIPQTVAGRRQTMMSYLDRGVFGPVGSATTSRKFLQAAEHGQMDFLFEEPTIEDRMERTLSAFLDMLEQNPPMMFQFFMGSMGQGGPQAGAEGAAENTQPPLGPA